MLGKTPILLVTPLSPYKKLVGINFAKKFLVETFFIKNAIFILPGFQRLPSISSLFSKCVLNSSILEHFGKNPPTPEITTSSYSSAIFSYLKNLHHTKPGHSGKVSIQFLQTLYRLLRLNRMHRSPMTSDIGDVQNKARKGNNKTAFYCSHFIITRCQNTKHV